jgi:hypothetical protein
MTDPKPEQIEEARRLGFNGPPGERCVSVARALAARDARIAELEARWEKEFLQGCGAALMKLFLLVTVVAFVCFALWRLISDD